MKTPPAGTTIAMNKGGFKKQGKPGLLTKGPKSSMTGKKAGRY